jgi:hypothetical protein
MYGQDSDKRYPSMQNEFFNRAGDILRRREALRGFVALCECLCACGDGGMPSAAAEGWRMTRQQARTLTAV